MLTTEQIRKVAAQSGARDIEKVEIDIILTHLLQLFHEKGITEHVAFKGGTMLRKMIFSPRGRYSTDLDFTLRSEATDEQVMGMVLDALGESYHGISFKIDIRTGILRTIVSLPIRRALTPATRRASRS